MTVSLHRATIVAFAFGILTLHSASASADEPAADRAAASASPWYGWQYAAADAGGVGLLVYARAESRGPLIRGITSSEGWHHPVGATWSTPEGIGTSLYLGGGPLVHGFHGQAVNAFASFGVRLLPLALVQVAEPTGALVGFFVRDSHGQPARCGGGFVCIDPAAGSHADDGSRIGADVGLFTGAVAAIAIDQVALSRGDVGRSRAATPPSESSSVSWAPDVRVGQGSAYAGASGRF